MLALLYSDTFNKYLCFVHLTQIYVGMYVLHRNGIFVSHVLIFRKGFEFSYLPVLFVLEADAKKKNPLSFFWTGLGKSEIFSSSEQGSKFI